MRKHYILLLLSILSMSMGSAQIVQVTDMNPAAASSISYPFIYQGDIYFQANDGSAAAREFWVIRADGTVEMVKDINQDEVDTSPNGDPKNFISYKGNLYFNGNDGDKTGHGSELWVSDGTAANTQMVADINTAVGKGSNPQQMFLFNDKLYFQSNDGASTQWWAYDGINVPVKVTSLKSGGFATPQNAVVDAANGLVYFQASADNNKTELHVMKTDETVEQIKVNTLTDHGYVGSQAVLYNGKLIFQGDNGIDGDELWVSDGTVAGTSMLKDINIAAAANSDPESFMEYKGMLYFVANPGTGDQLWVTDGTSEGTVLAAETAVGADGLISNLYVYNDKLYFSASDGVNGEELWVFDGVVASMLKDINLKTSTGSEIEGFSIVDGLLFFTANDSTGTKLWVSDGTAERTMLVSEALNTSVDPMDVNPDEFAIVGTVLYYTADAATGDEFFKVDARPIFAHILTVLVNNDSGTPIEGASVEFNGKSVLTAADGTAVFEYVRTGSNLPYSISKLNYSSVTGVFEVQDEDVNETIILTPVATFSVTINVSDGTNPLEGAIVNLEGVEKTTDASGSVVYEGLEPADDLAYTISLASYTDASGTIEVVDADVTENVTLSALYSITFVVTDGTDPLVGALVEFNGTEIATDATGTALFENIGTGIEVAYTISMNGFLNYSGAVNVNSDMTVNITMLLNSTGNLKTNQYSVYPNPSYGEFTIGGDVINANYRIYNVKLQLVEEGVFTSDRHNMKLDPGFYFLRISKNGKEHTEKLIVK